MKVLFGVDGSDASLEALRQGATFLSPARDAVALYYSPPKISFREAGAQASQLEERARKALSDAVFAESRKHLPQPLADAAHTIVGEQSPTAGLILAADEWRADLIVVGSQGTSPNDARPIGSTAHAVVQSAPVPVLVVRPRSAGQADMPWRVMLAYDGSEASDRAGRVLAEATWPASAVGYVLTVVESLMPGEVPAWLEAKARDKDSEAIAQAFMREYEHDLEAKRQELMTFRQKLPSVFHGQEPVVKSGNPARRIVETASALGANLVVVGAQGKGAIQRLLIGSTSEAVLAQLPCSVLVVRRRQRP
jgi:nucleotide-binding universal stress UspA family protein